MQRFIFLVHLIERKIYGQPTIVFIILVTNIIEKGPFTCICAVLGISFSYKWFLILFDTLFGKHNKKPISKRSERNFLALDSFDHDILTRNVTSK